MNFFGGEAGSIPDYKKAEEILSASSHGAGALFGAAALVLCLVAACASGNTAAVVCAAIYGGSLVLLYTLSAVYHALRRSRLKYIFRVLDRCGVFLLIAGTYTPLTVITLYPSAPAAAVILLCVVWTAAAVGAVLSVLGLKRFRVALTVCCIAAGWSVIFALPLMARALGEGGTRLLVWGGIAYTAGAVLYGIGAKKRYFHSVFHFFALAGSVLHFLCIYFYVL